MKAALLVRTRVKLALLMPIAAWWSYGLENATEPHCVMEFVFCGETATLGISRYAQQ